MLKKILCVFISGLILISLAACKNEEKTQENDKLKEIKTVTVEDTDTLEAIAPEGDAAQTELALKDFGGSEILYYSPTELNDKTKNKISAFQKAYNCTVKISVGSGNVIEDLKYAGEAGIFYDIIETDNGAFTELMRNGFLSPQNEYISSADIYSLGDAKNAGLNSAVLSRFTVGDKIYASGSLNSCDFYLVYYNKKLFADNGLDDLYSLFVTEKYSMSYFSALSGLNDYISGTSLLQLPELSDWLNIKAQPMTAFENGEFVSKFYNSQAISLSEQYQRLIYGENPISIPKSGSRSFENGKAFMYIGRISQYGELSVKASESSEFGQSSENLGCVPLPADINDTAVQPAAAVRAYSSMNGSANGIAAACFALFESRIIDNFEDTAISMAVSEYIVGSFNQNGYVSELDFTAKDGESSLSSLINSVGLKLRDGNDAAMAMSSLMWQANEIVESASTDIMQRIK